jgi:transcription elongation factor Elf1
MRNQDITLDTIQGFPGLKTVEIARKKYRCAMDRTFSCGVVNSRLLVSRDLLKKAKLKFPSANSEVQKKIEQEVKKLETQYTRLSCRENSAIA